jgi:hypothetical protein
MPTQFSRHSFTLWFYDSYERAAAVASARVADAAAGGAGAQAQAAARDLLRDILAAGGEQGDGGCSASAGAGVIGVSNEGVKALQLRVAALSASALKIVATVTGLPSVQVSRH